MSAATRAAAFKAQRENAAQYGGWCLGRDRDYCNDRPGPGDDGRTLLSMGPLPHGAATTHEALALAQEARMAARACQEAQRREEDAAAALVATAAADAADLAALMELEGGIPEAAAGSEAGEIMGALRARIEALAEEQLVDEAPEAVLMGTRRAELGGNVASSASSSASDDDDDDCKEPVELVQAFFAQLSAFHEAGSAQEQEAAELGHAKHEASFCDSNGNRMSRAKWYALVATELVEWVDGVLGEDFLEEEGPAMARLVADATKRAALLHACAAARTARSTARAVAATRGENAAAEPTPAHGAAEAANAQAVMAQRRALIEAAESAVAAAQAAEAALGAAVAAMRFAAAAAQAAERSTCNSSMPALPPAAPHARAARGPGAASSTTADMDRMLATFGLAPGLLHLAAEMEDEGGGEEPCDNDAMRRFEQAVLEQHAAEAAKRYASAQRQNVIQGLRLSRSTSERDTRHGLGVSISIDVDEN